MPPTFTLWCTIQSMELKDTLKNRYFQVIVYLIVTPLIYTISMLCYHKKLPKICNKHQSLQFMQIHSMCSLLHLFFYKGLQGNYSSGQLVHIILEQLLKTVHTLNTSFFHDYHLVWHTEWSSLYELLSIQETVCSSILAYQLCQYNSPFRRTRGSSCFRQAWCDCE